MSNLTVAMKFSEIILYVYTILLHFENYIVVVKEHLLFHYMIRNAILIFKQKNVKGHYENMFISICDDNPLHIENTLVKLKQLPVCKGSMIRTFQSPTVLLDAIRGGMQTDILIIDIDMPQMNGIELAQHTNTLNPAIQVVFLTGYAQYAQDVYDVEHVYMVLKGKEDSHFAKAIEKAVEKWTRLNENYMRVQSAGRMQVLLYNDVWYLERSGRRTCVHTGVDGIWTYQPPEELLLNAEPDCFFQCHKSYHVNLRAIVSWERICFILRNNMVIPISRPYQNVAKDWFFKGVQNRV